MNPGKQKTTALQGEQSEPLTYGTIVAGKARARANSYTDEKREELLAGALARIFGNNGQVKADNSGH
jgi:hypothetical protein